MRRMTPKERIVAVLRGQPTDRVPFTAYETLVGAKEELQQLLGCENIGFTRWSSANDIQFPNCKTEVQDFERGGMKLRRVSTITPAGRLEELYRFDPTYGSQWHVEFPVKGPKDYAAYIALLDDAVVTERYAAFEREIAELGDAGLPMASVGRTPYQKLAIEAVGLMNLGLHLVDYPAEVERAMQAIERVWRQAMQHAARSPALIVNIPDNLNAPMIGLERFQRYCVPLYNEAAEMLKGTDKALMVHMDGRLRALRDAVPLCRHRVIESFCPEPDGDVSVKEAVAWWPDKVLWVNFPSSVHLYDPKTIRAMADRLLKEGGASGRMLIGLMENVPPFAWRQSLPQIGEAIEAFGEPAAHR